MADLGTSRRAADDMIRCHEAIRRFYPEDWRQQLSPLVDGLLGVSRQMGRTPMSIVVDLAADASSNDDDGASIWILAAAVEIESAMR